MLICNKCNYQKEQVDNYEDFVCAICNGKMTEGGQSGKPFVEKGIAEIVCKDAMEQQLKQIGSDNLWLLLEKINTNAKERLECRKYFFAVGGKVQGSEIKI